MFAASSVPYDYGGSTAASNRSQCLCHNGRLSGCLNRKISSAGADIENLFQGIPDAGVRAVRCSHRGRGLQPFLTHIHCNNRVAPGDAGSCNRTQANATRSKNDQALAWLRFCGVEHRPKTRRDRAAQDRPVTEIDSFRQGGQPAFAHHRVPAECRNRSRIYIPVAEPVHGSRHGRTGSADPGQDDPVTRLNLIDTATDITNDAATLVPEAVGQVGVVAAGTVAFEELGVAYAAISNLNQYLAGFEVREFKLDDLQRFSQNGQYRGDRLHPFTSVAQLASTFITFPVTPSAVSPNL